MRPETRLGVMLALTVAGCGGRSALLPGQDGELRGDRTRRGDLAVIDLLRRPDRAGREAQVDRSCGEYVIEAEDSSQVSVTPGWLVSSGGVLHGGQGLESSGTGGKVSWSFKGTALTVFYEGGPNRGVFSVSVDGKPAVVVDSKAPSFTFQVPAPIVSGLPLGTHSATLVCQTQICAIDFFLVAGC